MRWTEPRETAQARASFWNQPRIIVPLILYSAVIPFTGFGLMTAIAIRLRNDNWDWNTSLLIGTLAGLVVSLTTFANRYPATQQEIELRPYDFSISGSSEHCMAYDQLRGYFIMQVPLGNVVQRTLLLSPKTNGHFSVGLPENTPDDAIHAVLSHHLPFVTIFDKQSLHITT